MASFTWAVTAAVSPTASATAPITIPSSLAIPPAITLATPAAQLGRVGLSRRLQIRAIDAAHRSLTYRAVGLPAGLRINPVSGLVSGTPTRAVRTRVTVTAIDAVGGSARAAFTWIVAGRPRVRASSVRLLPGGDVRLSVTLLAGAQAAAIKSIVVSVPRAVHLSLTARDRARGVSAVSRTGLRLSNTTRLVRGAVAIRLTRAARDATVRLFSPQVSLSRQLTANLRSRRARTVKLIATSVDGAGVRTRLFATATVMTPSR